MVFALLSSASFLYDRGSNLVSSMASGVGHLFRANSPVRVQSRPQADRDDSQESWPDFQKSKPEVTRILMKNKEENPASGTRAGIDSSEYHNDVQTTVVPAIPAIEHEIAPFPRKRPHDEPTGTRPRKADREQRFFQGLFEVTADSLVFDQPRKESALLKTLRPGSQVRVEQKLGNFLLVRSMKDPALSGYVPLEDAYFKRIQ